MICSTCHATTPYAVIAETSEGTNAVYCGACSVGITDEVAGESTKNSRLMLAAYAAAAAAVVALLLVASTAQAVPGEMCRSTAECSRGEVCVADSVTSSTGHCASIRVLP